MSSLDPINMATRFATLDIQPFQQRYQLQSNKYQGQLTALGKVESALRDFRDSVNEINSAKTSIIKNAATTSQDGFLTASADADGLVGNYQVFIEQVATAHQLSTDMPTNLDASTEVPTTGTLDFTINGETMSIALSSVDTNGDSKATMAELVNMINTSSDNPGVNATLVRSNGQTHLMLSSTETGVANQINVSASGTGQSWFEDAFTNTNDISTPQDAIIWLGAESTGLKLTNSSNTFEGVIDGVDLTVSKAQTSGDSPISVKVGPDADGTKEQLDKFVESYNALMSTIDEYTSYKSGDNQRGILASDPTLRSIESQLSTVLRGEYSGLRISEVGITLDRDGKMTVDQSKFTEAQKSNGSALEALFNDDGALLDSLDNVAAPFLKFSSGTFQSRKDALQASLDRIEDKQTTLERKYEVSYNRYLTQFTQMNTLMTQMNQTMSLFG